jgi:hypothetical protein
MPMTRVEIPMAKKQKKDVFLKFGPKLPLDMTQGEIGDKDSRDLLFGLMAGETFLPIINGINVSEDFFSLGRGVDHCFIKRLRRSMVADLTGGITDINDFPHIFFIDGYSYPANSIQDEDILHIRILADRFKDIFHLILVFG